MERGKALYKRRQMEESRESGMSLYMCMYRKRVECKSEREREEEEEKEEEDEAKEGEEKE